MCLLSSGILRNNDEENDENSANRVNKGNDGADDETIEVCGDENVANDDNVASDDKINRVFPLDLELGNNDDNEEEDEVEKNYDNSRNEPDITNFDNNEILLANRIYEQLQIESPIHSDVSKNPPESQRQIDSEVQTLDTIKDTIVDIKTDKNQNDTNLEINNQSLTLNINSDTKENSVDLQTVGHTENCPESNDRVTENYFNDQNNDNIINDNKKNEDVQENKDNDVISACQDYHKVGGYENEPENYYDDDKVEGDKKYDENDDNAGVNEIRHEEWSPLPTPGKVILLFQIGMLEKTQQQFQIIDIHSTKTFDRIGKNKFQKLPPRKRKTILNFAPQSWHFWISKVCVEWTKFWRTDEIFDHQIISFVSIQILIVPFVWFRWSK